jgi:hypothetical protein
MARFATFTVGAQAVVLPKGLQFEFPRAPEFNYIDGLVTQIESEINDPDKGWGGRHLFIRLSFSRCSRLSQQRSISKHRCRSSLGKD